MNSRKGLFVRNSTTRNPKGQRQEQNWNMPYDNPALGPFIDGALDNYLDNVGIYSGSTYDFRITSTADSVREELHRNISKIIGEKTGFMTIDISEQFLMKKVNWLMYPGNGVSLSFFVPSRKGDLSSIFGEIRETNLQATTPVFYNFVHLERKEDVMAMSEKIRKNIRPKLKLPDFSKTKYLTLVGNDQDGVVAQAAEEVSFKQMLYFLNPWIPLSLPVIEESTHTLTRLKTEPIREVVSDIFGLKWDKEETVWDKQLGLKILRSEFSHSKREKELGWEL